MAIQKHPSAEIGKSDRGAAASSARPAIFLDRDGTLIEEKEYLSEPREIALIPGAAAALARLREAGFALVIVTNQSAVGRGWLSETKLCEIHAELEAQLSQENVHVDAIYSCPDFDPDPDEDENKAEGNPRADRKPGAGMLFRAANELNLDLSKSWMVGDHIRDLVAGQNAGCRGSLLVLTGHGRTFKGEAQPDQPICQDLTEASQQILKQMPKA